MSERTEAFEISGSPRLVLRVPAGEVSVVAGAPGTVAVRLRTGERNLSRIAVTREGSTVEVGPKDGGFGHWPALEVEVAVGAAPDVRVRCGSADVRLGTAVRSVEVAGASGDVSAGAVEGSLTVRLASGDLEAASVGDRLDVVTASGRVRVREVGGAAEVKTASGDIVLGTVGGDCTARTASGRVLVGSFGGSRFEAKTVSGGIRVGVPAGGRYSLSLQSLSGDVRADFPVSGEGGTAPGRIVATSVSGDVSVIAAGT